MVVGSLRRDRGGVDQLWRSLAELHVHGQPVDWQRVLPSARKVDLPTYAFQRQRHWLDAPTRATTTAAGQVPGRHPWIGAMTTLAGHPGHLLMGRLSVDEHPWLADHVVADAVLAPGAGLLDVTLSAAREAGADAVAELTLLEPLVLTSATRLQATVGEPDARGSRPFALHSQPENTTEPLTWRHHVTGELVTRAATNGHAVVEDLREWPVPGTLSLDRDEFYSRARSEGLAYGPAFQCLRELARRDEVFYGRVCLPESLDPTGYGLHPALLDAALQVVVAGLMESSTDSRPLVPFIWSDVELYSDGHRELRVRVDLHRGAEDPAPATVTLADQRGRRVARIGSLKFRRAGRATRVEHLYRVGFETAPTVDEPLTGTVLVGDSELGQALGVDVASDLDSLFDTLDTAVPQRLVCTPHDTDESAAEVLRSLWRCLADPRLTHTELVWLTRDAVATSQEDEARHWLDASVWGLVRVVRTEQPERVLRLVDLDAGPLDPTLLARVLATSDEPEWALRGEAALVPRLRPVQDPVSAEHEPVAIDPDGTVLITGGLGELGGALAQHLVRAHGARRLVLSSRRGADTPEAEPLVGTLTDAGAEQVSVVACDVARRAEVAAMLDGIDPQHPLTAVFHLAGVLDDGLVQGFTEERLHRVMAPKVSGARHLDELTEGLDLAAFVLYSSAAGTLGTAGQCGYAAANAALDSLAANRRGRGLAGLSLAFGLWEQAGVGMTAHLGKAELGRLRRQGIGALTLEQGHRALDAALARPDPYLVPVRLELASLRHALGGARPPGLLRALVRAEPSQADAAAEPSLDLAGISETERLTVLVELVRGEVAAVLGLPGPDRVPSDKALRSLGIDSLTMIELRKRLAKRANATLPATLVFDYPTADAIAGLLLREGATR
jgi:pimaricinolide synthase PimS1